MTEVVPDELVTAVGDMVVPVDNSLVVVVDDDVALVDEVVPAPLVAETASCASVGWAQAANTISVSNEIGNRVIVPTAPFEPRLEQETSNRIVSEAQSNFQLARFCPSGLFLNRAISLGELDTTSSTISILDPERALPGTSILPR